jgi:hypothetical protein
VHRALAQKREDRRADVTTPRPRATAAALAGEELERGERAPRPAAMVVPPPVGPTFGDVAEHMDRPRCSVS